MLFLSKYKRLSIFFFVSFSFLIPNFDFLVINILFRREMAHHILDQSRKEKPIVLEHTITQIHVEESTRIEDDDEVIDFSRGKDF